MLGSPAPVPSSPQGENTDGVTPEDAPVFSTRGRCDDNDGVHGPALLRRRRKRTQPAPPSTITLPTTMPAISPGLLPPPELEPDAPAALLRGTVVVVVVDVLDVGVLVGVA